VTATSERPADDFGPVLHFAPAQLLLSVWPRPLADKTEQQLHCSKKIISHLSEISPAQRGWSLVSYIGVTDLMIPKYRRASARCVRA